MTTRPWWRHTTPARKDLRPLYITDSRPRSCATGLCSLGRRILVGEAHSRSVGAFSLVAARVVASTCGSMRGHWGPCTGAVGPLQWGRLHSRWGRLHSRWGGIDRFAWGYSLCGIDRFAWGYSLYGYSLCGTGLVSCPDPVP